MDGSSQTGPGGGSASCADRARQVLQAFYAQPSLEDSPQDLERQLMDKRQEVTRKIDRLKKQAKRKLGQDNWQFTYERYPKPCRTLVLILCLTEWNWKMAGLYLSLWHKQTKRGHLSPAAAQRLVEILFLAIPLGVHEECVTESVAVPPSNAVCKAHKTICRLRLRCFLERCNKSGFAAPDRILQAQLEHWGEQQ